MDLLRKYFTSFNLQLNIVVQRVPQRYELKGKREKRRQRDYENPKGLEMLWYPVVGSGVPGCEDGDFSESLTEGGSGSRGERGF